MKNAEMFTFLFFVLGYQLSIVQCQVCHLVSGLDGTISDSASSSYRKCWTIPVTENRFARLHLTSLTFQGSMSCQAQVRVTVAGIPEEYIFCNSDNNKNPVVALNNLTVTYIHSKYNRVSSQFSLKYEIKDLQCAHKESFSCNTNICIPKTKVCDGVKDCENGADELGCETGIMAIKEVAEARKSAVSWLMSKRSSMWGWKEDTARSVAALYLTSAANFNGTNMEEELMAKQTELKTAVALLRPSLTMNELSMFVNGLLVTCHDPRHFYGHNLVKKLKEGIDLNQNSTHPFVYLSLCNANETWPDRAVADLKDILRSNSKYPFVHDLRAIAIIALSCYDNHSTLLNNSTTGPDILSLYQDTISQFKKLQLLDGSFGNIYTTALITQALISSGQENSKDWNLKGTIQFIIKELNSSSVDFLSVYLTLPILNGKSLADIAEINCSANPRTHGKDPVYEIRDYIGPKIRVQYSLYVGDEKDVIHTISLRVPANYTAHDVMELAKTENPKYSYEWKDMSGKMYIYQIAKIANDPEIGKFWLLYVSDANDTAYPRHLTTSPNELVMQDGEHLIMWYKTTSI